MYWPDGREVATGLKAFCGYGERFLGLGRQLEHCSERLIDIVAYPVASPEERMTRSPGQRVRRFSLRRRGNVGRIHFIDGTPTEVSFAFGRDEPTVLAWCGLNTLPDGGEIWLDISSRAAVVEDLASVGPSARRVYSHTSG